MLEVDENYFLNYTLSIKKFNRTTTVLNSDLILLKTLGDECVIKAEVFGMQGNEYRKVLPTIRIDKCCTFLTEDKIVYPTLRNHSNVPEKGPNMCPFLPNYYYFKNVILELDKSGGIPVPYNTRKIKAVITATVIDHVISKNAYYIAAQ